MAANKGDKINIRKYFLDDNNNETKSVLYFAVELLDYVGIVFRGCFNNLQTRFQLNISCLIFVVEMVVLDQTQARGRQDKLPLR